YRYHKRLANEQKQVLQESGFSDLYPDMRLFYLDQQAIHGTANKRMIEAVRSNPEVDGYCIHALVAGDWILGAGLLDLWRNPKSYAYEATKAANQPRILSIRTKPRNIYARKGAELEIAGINELESVATRLQIEILSESGEVIYNKNFDTNWHVGVSQLFNERLETNAWTGSYTVRANIFTKDDKVLAENTFDFDVFSNRYLVAPESRIAVLDEKGTLTSFLKKKGFMVVEFNNKTNKSIPVFVTKDHTKSELDNKHFKALFEFMYSGGTAVYIEGIKETIPEESSIFPFSAKVHPAKGLWTCIPHLVHKHPVFEGLPSNGMMRNVYENVWATNTLRDIEVIDDMVYETLVASIGFDWFSSGHKMHYSGPGVSWWGSDMAVVSYGKGRCIISQLRLVENLGKDPVADKILFNMIRFASNDEAKN
ncbi:MAG: hypothetical protein KAK04_14660, partial [Cyclobacteriaceae bacterium]|nr:hypothetical protein [Cyclobacteriaceae bacterium]